MQTDTSSGKIQRVLPALGLLAFLLWGWRGQNLLHSVPGYGDILEVTWALSWLGDAIRTGQNLSVYPLAFHPGGWPIGTYAEGPFLLLAMLPLHWLGGAAFAYNVTVLLSFIVAFAGAYRLARTFVLPLPATVAALLTSFWGLRWFQTIGHPNILIGSALLPWLLWALDRGMGGLQQPARGRWLFLSGILWATAIAGTVYFVWIGGLAVASWVIGRGLAERLPWRRLLLSLLLPSLIALILSAPGLYWSWRDAIAIDAPLFTIGEVNFWGTSLNSLPAPSLDHPWLGALARRLYAGLPYEQGMTNLGWAAVIVAGVGVIAARKEKAWRPVFMLTAVGLILALGLTLKWDNTSVQVSLLRPFNQLWWRLGHFLKPDFFTSIDPPAPFDQAVPLPGMILALLIPIFERARVFARYALIGSIGLYLLTARGLVRVQHRWLQLGIVALLLFEVLPTPLEARPFPTPPHPAFTWLRQQDLGAGSIIDLVSGHPYTPVLYNGGETVWATRYHHKPTVSGASSVWPGYTSFLYQWLATHEHSFWNLDTIPILRFYGVRTLLLHMRSADDYGILEEAKQNPELQFRQCFDPVESTAPSPWPYPICVLDILPSTHSELNLVLGEGWSGKEDWGVWAEGTVSRALWVATARQDHHLQVAAFPYCLEDRLRPEASSRAPLGLSSGRRLSRAAQPEGPQSMTLEVNGVVLATYAWPACDPWLADVVIPASLIRLGGNDLVVRSGYAVRPSELGQSADTRQLSVGFTKLKIERP